MIISTGGHVLVMFIIFVPEKVINHKTERYEIYEKTYRCVQ